jgi:hypothetical protein
MLLKKECELTRIAAMLMLATLMFADDALADIYKCTDEDGNVAYSQTPCVNQKTENIGSSSADSASGALDCSYANRFALSTARRMRNGARSSDLFNLYGGLNTLSVGTIGVINYVYSYRSNDDVSVERIASLTQAKCRARSLGDVSCEALPLSYTESFGGCDANPEEIEIVEPPPVQQQPVQRSTSTSRSPELIEECKDSYRDQIDEIDAQMRRGYSSAQGEVYRERLRTLTQQLRACG